MTTNSKEFEELLFYTAARHCEELNHRETKTLSDDWSGESCIGIFEPELRALLIDMYERAFEDGYAETNKNEIMSKTCKAPDTLCCRISRCKKAGYDCYSEDGVLEVYPISCESAKKHFRNGRAVLLLFGDGSEVYASSISDIQNHLRLEGEDMFGVEREKT